MSPNERLAALASAGVSLWLDDMPRERLTSGNLQELITDKSAVGVHDEPDDLSRRQCRTVTPTTRRCATWHTRRPRSTTP